MSQLNWIELFGGGGGVGTGLEQAGHTVSTMIELDPEIAQCYRDNHPHTKVITSDIRDVCINTLPGNINALWASPVCKGHSTARNPHLAQREDIAIGLAIIPYIQLLQPELVVIENVKQYETHSSFHEIVKCLLNLHYSLDCRVINTSDYGIPQDRERLILQARRGPIAWPDYQHKVSWYTALEDMLPTLPRVDMVPWQRELWKEEYERQLPVLIYGIYQYRTSKDEPKELAIRYSHQQARTVTATATSLRTRVILPDMTGRQLDIAGNARLQTFPDRYIWPHKRETAMQVIGNAVPPLLVQKLTENYTVKPVQSIVESECVA